MVTQGSLFMATSNARTQSEASLGSSAVYLLSLWNYLYQMSFQSHVYLANTHKAVTYLPEAQAHHKV